MQRERNYLADPRFWVGLCYGYFSLDLGSFLSISDGNVQADTPKVAHVDSTSEGRYLLSDGTKFVRSGAIIAERDGTKPAKGEFRGPREAASITHTVMDPPIACILNTVVPKHKPSPPKPVMIFPCTRFGFHDI